MILFLNSRENGGRMGGFWVCINIEDKKIKNEKKGEWLVVI